MGYDGVIFDFDGVLLDSTMDSFRWANRVRKEEVECRGWNIDLNGFEQGIFQPHHSEKIAPILEEKGVSWHQLRLLEEAVADKKVEFVKEGEIQLYPDAERLLQKIDLPKAVVSNAYDNALDRTVKILGLDRYLDFWVAPSLSEIETCRSRMKPECVLIEYVIDELGLENPVMVGDQDVDILAAEKAGIDSIFIDRGYHEPGNAIYTVSSLEEIIEIVCK
jgi:phosphoglycolate phosphatase-like HAD superfamily hydrolase